MLSGADDKTVRVATEAVRMRGVSRIEATGALRYSYFKAIGYGEEIIQGLLRRVRERGRWTSHQTKETSGVR